MDIDAASVIMARPSWLYVDESGRFDREDEGVVVAGLLARDGAPATVSGVIERELRRLAPGMPWPLHAHCYGTPLVHGLLSAPRHASKTESGRDIRKALHEHQGLINRVERSLRDGEEPSFVDGEPSLRNPTLFIFTSL